VISNTDISDFDVVEVTNEMPLNRIGGVGTVVEHLIAGLRTIGVRALWYVVDHRYRPHEIDRILDEVPSVAVGTAEELASVRASLVHLHSYNHHEGLLRATDSVPVLYTVHSLLALEERSNGVRLGPAVGRQLALMRHADSVAVVSDSERGHYRRLGYERLNDDVHVVPNGIVDPGRRRRNHGDRSIVGYCGRLVPRKHPDYLPRLLAEPDLADTLGLVAGKFFSPYARDLVERLEVEDRVRYLGWCGPRRLERFWESIDVFVLPTAYEPFGLAALEAATRGIPVVCTRVDGLGEILGDHAWYCEDTTYDAFVDAVRRFRRATGAEVERHVDHARRRALECFSEITMASAYRRRFDALAAAAA